MSEATRPKIHAVKNLPPGVAFLGSLMVINLDRMSPAWVNELYQTKAGKILLRRIVLGMIKTELCEKIIDDLAKEIADDLQKTLDRPLL